MSLTNEPDGIPVAGPPPERPEDHERITVPNKDTLRWPIVQVLRDVGQASEAELVELVADSLRLTDQQRGEMIPSGQETRLKTRVRWAAHELKQIGAVYYPEPSIRALTALGNEIDDDQIKDLHRAFQAEERRRKKDKKKGEHVPTDTPTVWLIRAGDEGQRYDYNIEHGLACLGFGDFADLRGFSNRQELWDDLRRLYEPDTTDRAISSYASQLWRMCTDVRLGDVVVMPRKGRPKVALGTVTRRYWFDDTSNVDWGRHVVAVDWAPDEVLRTVLRQDLDDSMNRPPTLYEITSPDSAWRFQQVLETGRDPGPRASADNESLDLPALVEQFLAESGYPTKAHEEQKRLRAEWAEKLAPENVASLTREDLAAYVSPSVDYADGEYVKPGARMLKWIRDLDDTQYARLLDGIGELCWGTDELTTRIDRLVDERGASRKDTGTKGFAQLNLNVTLAICHSDRFLQLNGHGGKWGYKNMLSKLNLSEPRGSTFAQRYVDANDRLRGHLVPHLGDDPQAIACFLHWLIEQATDTGEGDEPDKASDLSALVERFRAETGYPTAAYEEQERLRAEWAEKLAPEHIADFSRLDLTGVASRGTLHRARYVYPDVQGVMKWIRQLDEDEYSDLLDSIDYLCWGEDEAWVRYDQVTDRRNPRRLRGYANPTAIRLLAITHPKDFLPLGPYPGVFSRLRRYLDLDRPQGSSYGQRVMDANNRLFEHLEPQFGDDTLEMSAFLEWLIKEPPPPGDPNLPELADELLVDVEFLKDIVSLLEDKGQVILYGPPGTGKTYLARALAKALAPDETCRALVQFHPSTSYEDFFEGYRPAGTGDDGGIRYELTPGPLARMAEQAEATDEQHVMIIDEINRGNLPRVLGELLFLLEYRKESVQTLYRPEEPFELPENLWFIGTMNTADRSIALVDAALRRRFHFLPFFPDKWPMAGLLARWLEREGEPGWVGDLVDAVNDELKKALEGSHLLLGPSHFMKRYGSSPDEQRERLRRIWEYNIEPFIEDQLFGDPDQINRFRFGSIVSRHRAIIERDHLSILADGEELDQGAEASGSSEAQSSSERSRARRATTPAWKDQFQGTPTAPTDHDGLWKWRASNFPHRTEGRGEFQIYEIGSWACRWVEFALNAGVDPGKYDSQLVEDLLSPYGYSQSSLTAYRRHLREWFDTDHDSAG